MDRAFGIYVAQDEAGCHCKRCCDEKTHDLKVFKESGYTVQPHVLILADAGYQGISKIHKNRRITYFFSGDFAKKQYNLETNDLTLTLYLVAMRRAA